MVKSNFQKLIIVINVITIIVFLYWRFQYGLSRYFDIDEFAHLHWSHNVFIGLRPYTDFFYFFPPFFLYLLLPLFWIVGRDAVILLLARGFAFGIFALTTFVLFLLVKKIKGLQTALLTVLIFIFLPIPSDKWIEIRPDGITVLFSLLGMLFLVKGIDIRREQSFFLAGLFYAVGVLITPKLLPLAVIGAIVAVIVLSGSSTFQESVRPRLGRCLYGLLSFILGGLIPVLITVLLIISYGNVGKSFYLVTKVAADASKVLGSKFPIPPNFLFYPNDIYYGAPGYSLPHLMNLIIWSVATIWGIVKLVSFLDKKEKREALVELLLAASFWVSLFAFMWVFPLRHGQYLMPVSVFIAFYFADFLMRSYKWIDRVCLACTNLVCLAVIVIIFFAGKQMYDWKLRWPPINTQYYSTLFKLIPEGEKVYDLTGETIFSPDGYYFCCIPYGQYEEALGQKPDLERELRQNRVKFVYMQNEGRLSVLPRAHDAVLRKYYTIYPSGNPPFLLVSGALVHFEAGQEEEFDLIASGKYLLIWNNKVLTKDELLNIMKIDGKVASVNPIEFSEGKHRIKVSEKGLMKIMYSL